MRRSPAVSFALPLAVVLTMGTGATPARADDSPVDCAPVQQLRIYEIPRENRQVFHERFRDHAVRIMRRHGFEILAMWESEHEGKLEFVYLLEWPDVATMKAQWAKFMADEEWAAIKKKTAALHGTYVESIQDRMLCPVPYSPKRIG